MTFVHSLGGVVAYALLRVISAFDKVYQVKLASALLPRPSEQIKQLGSIMVCESKDRDILADECKRMQELGCECRFSSMPLVACKIFTSYSLTAHFCDNHHLLKMMQMDNRQ